MSYGLCEAAEDEATRNSENQILLTAVSQGITPFASTGDDGSSCASNSFSNLPGTDQFMPLLPDHSVKPGDTWTKSFTQAFPFGSGSLTYSSVNSLERYETAGGVRTAVIHTTMSVPIDLTMDLRRILALSGQDRSLPRGTNRTIVYAGKLSMTQTAWFDPKMGQMVKSSSQGRFEFTMRFRGFPARSGQPSGQIAFAGTMSVAVDRR